MKLKFLVILGLATGLTMSLPLAASAQTTAPKEGGKTATLTRLNTNCSTAISQRQTSLTAATTRINGLKKLSTNYKNQYLAEINTDLSGLQTIQGQCAADYSSGNVQALKSDYQSIFTKYRIYAVFLPQMWHLIASDTMGVTVDNLTSLQTKLQTRVQSVGNPANLTALLSDMQAKITDAESQYSRVQSQVTSLTPNSYNSDPGTTTSILKNAKAEIKTGSTDLAAAFSDAKQIAQGLKALHPTKAVPAPTGI